MARRQRNTNNRISNNQTQNPVSDSSVVQTSNPTPSRQEEKKGFFERFNSIGGVITLIIGFFGAGVAAGTYINSVAYGLEKMELEKNYQKEIEALRKEKYMTKEDVEEFIKNYNKANDGSKE